MWKCEMWNTADGIGAVCTPDKDKDKQEKLDYRAGRGCGETTSKMQKMSPM